MNSVSASILIFLIAVVSFGSRRLALLAMAAGVLYLTEFDAIKVAGFNMFAIRFLEVAGFIRVMARREFGFSRLNRFDRLFLLFYSYLTIIFLLRSNEGQAFQAGLFIDAVFCYFTFRGLAGDMEDFVWFLRTFVILLVPYVALLFVEMWTTRNLFSILEGGAVEHFLRAGRIRCTGSFREYSILGSLGASFLPLYIGLGRSRPGRWHAMAGVILCLAIAGLSNSGGPLAFVCIVVLGWMLWPLRDRMGLIRRLGLAGLVALAIAMKAPVWYLPVHFAFGGDAWHRSYLIELAVRHLGQWWLWGMPISMTSNWFTYRVQGVADITNQFLFFGLAAGLMAMILFVWMLARAFAGLGEQLATVRALPSENPAEAEYLLWGLGVMLAGHVANFFSITYFDQFYVIWFMQLAFISTLSQEHGNAYLPAVAARSLPLNFGHDSVAYSSIQQETSRR
ncbi:MAG: hypothetical protein P4L43_13820 [Syntrophobacteraceae bacterium]|nr:hypothetical protein [Syntrophobacteraceae bacterium]